ncbi:cellulase family glycosylhydrolase [Brevibacterium casei]|uniref:cellulase family glycosylhydrolase n=1 Tax=Brevibacterium casei TaxID=33889 RepID=UPI0021AE3400|nr:cellulase family glycosylhydrolase [Brevibacterium casei]MCT1550184.1 cellulase family glycosylhydrolase [Brevibacterium casei]MCT1560108.1 cellulase family glycosylhydrolase [Brevibacterium casei]MCT2208262.1 cellulase family glycosylhydrolase [Brevibacterium casei]
MVILVGAGGLSACTVRALPESIRPDGQNAPVRRLRTGATFHGFWNYDSEDEMLFALRTLRNAGGRWARIDMGWAAIETARGEYSDWALGKYDAAIDAARSEDLSVVLVLQRTPTWANGSDDESLAPRDPASFGDFALAMSQRYAGRIAGIETWNEPNQPAFFTARTAGEEAREHAAMVKDAYTKIKERGPQGDASPLVFAGGTSRVDVEWWEQMYALGIAGFSDVVAVNPYPVPPNAAITDGSRGPSPLQRLNELIAVMRREDDADRPIWFTEFGWPTGRSDEASRSGLTGDEQADRFEEAVRRVEDDYPQVEVAIWYNLRDRDDGGHASQFGLLDRNLKPKPVLDRMEQLFVGR